MSSRLHYFAYGSNMLTRRLTRRVPSARPVAPARLPGYGLAFHKRGRDGSGKANVVATGDPDDVVHGVLFELDRREKPALDRIEGGYTPSPVEVHDGTARLPAMTYVAQGLSLEDTLLPFCWYHDLVVDGALEHGLPTSWVETLASVPVVLDRDRSRLAAHRRILAS